MKEKDVNRAADMIRRTPPMGRERIHVPSSVRYGERWKSLPVATDERRPPHGTGFAIAIGSTIGIACLVYMLARVLLS